MLLVRLLVNIELLVVKCGGESEVIHGFSIAWGEWGPFTDEGLGIRKGLGQPTGSEEGGFGEPREPADQVGKAPDTARSLPCVQYSERPLPAGLG